LEKESYIGGKKKSKKKNLTTRKKDRALGVRRPFLQRGGEQEKGDPIGGGGRRISGQE